MCHTPTCSHPPTSFTRVSPYMRPIWVHATLDEVPYTRLRSLPRLPDAHPYAPAEPLVDCLKGGLHVRQLEVIDPATYRLMQYLFAPCVSHSVASACQQFQFSFQLRNALGVRTKPSACPRPVERVAEELHSTYVAHFSLLSVHLQMKFLLDELRDAFAHSFRASLAPAED